MPNLLSLPHVVSLQATRPNTALYYQLFIPHTTPMAAGQLSYTGWKELTEYNPECDVIDAILGICEFGTRIGYQERRTSVTIHPNLAISEEDTYLVQADIQSELEMGRLEQYTTPDTLPNNYTASPLGLVDKADGSKWRIHHLSYSPDN